VAFDLAADKQVCVVVDLGRLAFSGQLICG
jgi:hypothetical protein